MFLQPKLAGEDAYYNGDYGGGREQNELIGSPDTFFFIRPPSPSPDQSPGSPSQGQIPSPAQAYAQTFKQTNFQTDNHNYDEDQHRQLSNSDSANTPPSPTALGKRSAAQRRLIQRPSLIGRTSAMSKRGSNSHTPNHSNHNSTNASPNTKDNKHQRAQSLNALPQKTLIHLLQIKEEETKRAKKMLRTALIQLEMEVGRGEVLEGRVKELEERVEMEKVERVERERKGGMRALKGVLDEQRGRAGEGEEVEGLKLKLSNTEKELQRIKEDYRALQIERDDSDRALVRARTLAREMKEKAVLIQAREQGRQEGFEEGLRQGRLVNNEESSGEASGSGNVGGGERVRSRKTRGPPTTNNKNSSRRQRSNTNPEPSLEAEASLAAMKAIAERENLRVQLQLKTVERELDMERSRMKDVVRENGQLEKMVRDEKDRVREREREKEREREAKEEKEREMREVLKREIEKERREREKDRQQEKEQMEKDFEKKLAEAEENRIKVEKQLKKEKEKAAAINAAPPLPYLAMAPPPPLSTKRVPRPPSSGSHRRVQTRPSSMDSYTSQASSIPFDMLQLPNGERERRDLSVIHEDVSLRGSVTGSVSGSTPTPAASVPTWVTHPPVDYGKVPNDGSGPSWPQEPSSNQNPPYDQQPNQNHLTPSGYPSRSSTGSYEFHIVPPSRPHSIVGGGDPESHNAHNNTYTAHHNSTDDQLLSPNHRPIQLPQTQTQTPIRSQSPAAKPVQPRFATPDPHGHSRHQYDTSGMPTQPNTPVLSSGIPPGFIPQSITDARGRSTPIMGGGGGGMGFIPPGVGGGGIHPPGRSVTPGNQWHNPVIPPNPAGGPASIPIYGNPITLEREKKREETNDISPTTALPPPPQSPGINWSAPLAALNPPIFPINGPHQPFQQPPPSPSGGSWGGGNLMPANNNNNGSQENRQFNKSPSFEYSRPGQTSNSVGGWGGAGGFNSGGGRTPGSGNQELSPVVIPGRTGSGGGWHTPSHHAGGFGSGSTPGPMNQHLPPVIPTPSHRAGGFGSGMTPGPRNQHLSPVIPTGGFGSGMTPGSRSQDLPPVIHPGTPSHRVGAFGTGATPGPRNQNLSPFIPPGTPNHRPGGFASGATPGPRNQDLPPFIPPGTPSHRPGGFGSTPGPRNQDLPGGNDTTYQSSFSIYGPSTNNQGGGPRASSPYPNRPYSNEEENGDGGDDQLDATTVLNTQRNASANMSSGMGMPSVVSAPSGGGNVGGKKGKKGKKR